MLLEVAAFEAIDTKVINEGIWGSSLSAKEGDEFEIGRVENLGYDGPYVLPNLGPTLIMLSIKVLILLALLEMSKSKRCFVCIKRNKDVYRGSLTWNMPINFLIDSYSVLAICTLLNLQSDSQERAVFRLNFASSLVMMIILVSYPVLSQVFLLRNRRALNRTSFKRKFSSAYAGLQTYKSKFVGYQTMHLYRKLLIPAFVIFLSESLLAQFLCTLVTSAVIFCFVLHRRPFARSLLNTGAVVEELTI